MQKNGFRTFVFLLLMLIACGVFSPGTQGPTDTPPAAAAPTGTVSPSPSPTTQPSDTDTPSPVPPATSTAAAGPEMLDIEVRAHPDGGLFAGDQVSFEVIIQEGMQVENQEVTARFEGQDLMTARVRDFGIGNRSQATLQWAWDTTGLEPGDYPVSFSFMPDGETFTETFTLLPQDLLRYPEPDASWAVAESDCCLFYYVTGTAADRDLQSLLDIADIEAGLAVDQLGGNFEDPITVVFLPRVLGHGGFASGVTYISYLDRNYAGNSPAQVLHHEMIHILDGRKGGDLRPSLFVEGLAVYLSGGHFKKEAVVPRAAAAVDLGLYIPLADLADNFYFEQHEVSYLEGAALIQYMVETWGWEAFEDFYRNIPPQPSGLQSDAIDIALKLRFGLSFEQLEEQFLAYLDAQPEDSFASEDIRLSVDFFDTVRRYQQVLDPSAYFLTAWLIGIDEMTERGITADYVRHPAAPENLALEAMLVAADLDLRYGNYPESAMLLASVNRVLDGCDVACLAAFPSDPTAEAYLELVLASQEAGYTAQSIFLVEDSAIVLAWQDSNELIEVDWQRTPGGWELRN